MCEDCNQFWHVNNPIRQSHKVLMIDDCEDSINVAGDINSSSSAPAVFMNRDSMILMNQKMKFQVAKTWKICAV